MNGKQIFKVTTHERDSSVDFNSYNVIARDAADAIKKAAKVYVLKSERSKSVTHIGALDAF